jgi:hypothetical protein
MQFWDGENARESDSMHRQTVTLCLHPLENGLECIHVCSSCRGVCDGSCRAFSALLLCATLEADDCGVKGDPKEQQRNGAESLWEVVCANVSRISERLGRPPDNDCLSSGSAFRYQRCQACARLGLPEADLRAILLWDGPAFGWS